MPELEPITREEKFLNGEVGMTPITREEKILAGEDVETITRREYFLKKYRGGGDVTVEEITITENGTTTAPSGKAYSPIHTNVPQPTLTKLTATENGDYIAPSGTAYNEVEVALPLDDKTITQNGTYLASDDNLEGYDEVVVNVPLPQNAYLLKSVTTPTPIASFTDGEEMVMPTLKVAIEPQQEGSGDPSPTNIRPISGWSEGNVSVVGKNLFDADSTTLVLDKVRNDGGTEVSFSGACYTSSITAVKPNTTYVLNGLPSTPNVSFRIYYLDANGNWLSRTNTINFNSQPYSFTTPNNCGGLQFQLGKVNTDFSATQLELGTTATTYEPYNGHTYTIDLDGTRYGGELDVVSGVLTVDRVGVNGVTVATIGETGSGVKYIDTTHIYSDLVQNANAISDRYIQINTSASGVTGSFRVYKGEFTIYDNRFTDVATAQSLLNDVQIVYELATPLTIQLTPTAVKSLRGVNNVWAGCGQVQELSYFSKEV